MVVRFVFNISTGNSDRSFIGYRASSWAGMFSLAQETDHLEIFGGRRSSLHNHIVSHAVSFSTSNWIQYFFRFTFTFVRISLKTSNPTKA